MSVVNRRMSSEDCYGFLLRRTTSQRQHTASYLDGEHLLLCLVSAIAIYAMGYIVARLFFSGIMFFLSVGLVAFMVMQVADSLDCSVGDPQHRNAY